MLNGSNHSGDPDYSDDEPAVSKTTSSNNNNNDSTEDSRKVQNRIAQRDFRKRKQQHIKDMELKLAMFESGGNEQIETMRAGMKALVAENTSLRSLLNNLAGFIGNGLGGELRNSGIDIKDFNNLLKAGNTDVIHDALAGMNVNSNSQQQQQQQHQHQQQARQLSPHQSTSNSNQLNGTSRTSPNPRLGHSPNSPSNLHTSYVPGPSSIDQQSNQDQMDYLNANGNNTDGLQSTTSPSGTNSRNLSMGVKIENDIEFKAALEYVSIVALNEVGAGGEAKDILNIPTDNAKLQAIQLIKYHMTNKRMNSNYHLPPSLRFSLIQDSVPHSVLLDGIIYPSLRDRLILSQDQFDVHTLTIDLVRCSTIHSNDVLISSNWELSELFLKKYWFVIDKEVLNSTNVWRRTRGESIIVMADLIPS